MTSRRVRPAAAWTYVGLLLAVASPLAADAIDPLMHHLRSGTQREWEEFATDAESAELVVSFKAGANPSEHTLRLRQRDVKQPWQVLLNGRKLGALVADENEIVGYWAIPPGTLRDGDNELRVSCEAGAGAASDDISIGEAELLDRQRDTVLREATVEVEVVDGESGQETPCRVTIADERGALVTTGMSSNDDAAVRPGVLYLRNGRTKIAVPAGRHAVYAGRGFEYSLASKKVEARAGEMAHVRLVIRHVVSTDGYISCDTHVHTLTYSRHGDATLAERMLTIAGEGIELPVATEHNLQMDYIAAADTTTMVKFFTPVVGNEVTTGALGHFNVFPLNSQGKLLDWRPRDWPALQRSIDEIAPSAVVILNHARDVHGGFRPFDPRRHISVAGEPLDGVYPPANAMEVINSGATRSDPLELVRDWFGLLNRGRRVAPIGASDSHDVARYIVGQARTYVSDSPDTDPSRIDIERATRALAAGRVAVSYGLLADLTLNTHFTPGDLAALPPGSTGDVAVDLRVLGPEWTTATRIALYVNGVETHHADIAPAPGSPNPAGVKWQSRFTLARPKHDVYLVAIATGPGVAGPWWPFAKPYQPTRPRFTSAALGLTAPVYVDADGNGRFDSAFDYAQRLVTETRGDVTALSLRLIDYDEPTAVQAASVVRARDASQFESTCRRLIARGPPHVSRGIGAYLTQWQQTSAATHTDKAIAK